MGSSMLSWMHKTQEEEVYHHQMEVWSKGSLNTHCPPVDLHCKATYKLGIFNQLWFDMTKREKMISYDL